ncbi:hypothetical protein CDL12_14533 [Handroanthus impetiginosus]|uniref:Uncharacterized protein n=1 Tax=Handroanthus impetiginosus TaxID=429701 RepID=A0A2G9H5R2_9LAMI|nr:hypothetical protein CDL12_14533 [Handroanthus impetiginosus]
MELKNNHDEQNTVSVLQGNGFRMSRILARESSVGQSSRMFYRAAEGVPFKWETQPGTPKNLQEDDIIPPVCPSPLMQSIGLPLPNVEDDDPNETDLKTSKFWRLRKIMRKRMNFDISEKVEMLVRRNKHKESSSFGDFNKEFVDSVKDSRFSSNSSSFSSRNDGPCCCSPWDVPAILDEGNTKVYYCSQHKTSFAEEEDGSFPSRILSRTSTGDQFSGKISPAGIPFRWETQPGTPKSQPENELVPPPSPPPAVQNLALPRPRMHDDEENTKNSRWKRAWFWIRSKKKVKEDVKILREISFRHLRTSEILMILFTNQLFLCRRYHRLLRYRKVHGGRRRSEGVLSVVISVVVLGVKEIFLFLQGENSSH